MDIKNFSDHINGTAECNKFVAEQSKGSDMAAFTYEVVPMTKEEIEAHPDNQKQEKTPEDFCEAHPWSSVFQNSESETIAANVMVILKRTGNTFRDLSWEEYKEERLKDENFSEIEKPYFERVMPYFKSADTAALFSPDWRKIAES